MDRNLLMFPLIITMVKIICSQVHPCTFILQEKEKELKNKERNKRRKKKRDREKKEKDELRELADSKYFLVSLENWQRELTK